MKTGTWCFIAMTLAIAASTTGMVCYIGIKDPSAAGWAQAGGTIWAVLAAIWIGWIQSEQSRDERNAARSQAMGDEKRRSQEVNETIYTIANEIAGVTENILQATEGQVVVDISTKALDTSIDLLKAVFSGPLDVSQRKYVALLLAITREVFDFGADKTDPSQRFAYLKIHRNDIVGHHERLSRIVRHFADLDKEEDSRINHATTLPSGRASAIATG